MNINQKHRKKVPFGTPIFPNKPRLSKEELARRKAIREVFAQRCQKIFDQVVPQLIAKHYGWLIHIESNSRDYFIDPNSEVCFQKARQKHPLDGRLLKNRKSKLLEEKGYD